MINSQLKINKFLNVQMLQPNNFSLRNNFLICQQYQLLNVQNPQKERKTNVVILTIISNERITEQQPLSEIIWAKVFSQNEHKKMSCIYDGQEKNMQKKKPEKNINKNIHRKTHITITMILKKTCRTQATVNNSSM